MSGKKRERYMTMSEPLPLTPDEELVFCEYIRLDVEPNQIPPELFMGFLERMAGSVSMPLQRVRAATQGLIDKGKFDTVDEEKEECIQNEREILRDLLLHDPEIRELLKNIVAEMNANKNIREFQNAGTSDNGSVE
jgi:hypothetical protein